MASQGTGGVWEAFRGSLCRIPRSPAACTIPVRPLGPLSITSRSCTTLRALSIRPRRSQISRVDVRSGQAAVFSRSAAALGRRPGTWPGPGAVSAA